VTTEELAAELERLRGEATRLLGRLAGEFGAESRLARQCEVAWAEAHRAAVTSILHDDYGNATALLRDVVHALALAAEAARRGELSQDDIALLVRRSG